MSQAAPEPATSRANVNGEVIKVATAETTNRGSAEMQGELWGARARDYAEYQEPRCRALHEDAIQRTAIGKGSVVLDVGCGPGGFCLLAAQAGAIVNGIDAAQAHVELARRRVRAGRFEVGDMQFLPYDDDSFDVVSGFNSFQYAADPVAALAEARRVATRSGIVHAVVWGRAERTELAAVLSALRPLLPPAPAGAPGPFALSYPGALEALVRRSGLTPSDAGYLEVTFEYPDAESLLRGNGANGPVVLAERTSGKAAVADVTRNAFAPFRTSSGAYRIETEWRYVTAAA